MFGKRKDGKLVKNLGVVAGLMPLFAPRRRSGAASYYTVTHEAKDFDDFIRLKKAQGEKYNYLHIVVAILVRTFKMYPRLNRFIINDRIYQRNSIDMTMIVKKSMHKDDAGDEDVLKMRFTGFETIAEVKNKLETDIAALQNAVDPLEKAMPVFEKLPHFVLRFIVFCLITADKHGLLSDKFLFDISPFHSSFFVSYLKSINLDSIYHHLFDFGNCGFFITIGKETLESRLDDESNVVKMQKIIRMGITIDSRCIDGLYYSRFLRTCRRLMRDLTLLEKPLDEGDIAVG
ncbi:hypothetical protein AGMMS49944_07740 [Spirochaetia bacterium]|nr:hypothetical protein AGMMS49944_07740 [Spirochaetia bacterium]